MKPPILYIPTRGRVDKQQTLENRGSYRRILLVAPEGETGHPWKHVIHSPKHFSISQKRQWIADYSTQRGEEFHVQCDDDCYFRNRKDNSVADLADVLESMFRSMEDPNVAIVTCGTMSQVKATKARKNIATTGVLRMYRNSALDGISFSRVLLMEDLHVHLSLLEAGFDTVQHMRHMVRNNFGRRKGGNSDVMKDTEFYNREVRKIAKLHPETFKVTGTVPVNSGRAAGSLKGRQMVAAFCKQRDKDR